jgi:redox-sensitive bicupin YhaK (pirin superfamily)
MADTWRSVKQIIEPKLVIEGAGVLLRRSFGPSTDNPFDPFLLFDHFAFNDPREGPIMGFPTHPHRGIETVTYMLEGSVRHRDSLGNMGVIGRGDVQWMTSGRGILHEEMPKRGPEGKVNGFQLWVNLPASLKMSQPRYQEILAETIPTLEDQGAQIRLVAGGLNGLAGPVTEIAARPQYMDVTLQPGASFSLPVPAGHTAIAYVFDGAGSVGLDEHGSGTPVEDVRLIVFEDGERVRLVASSSSSIRFMLMTGGPFGEPIVPYGPFVMNTREEIEQALRDLRNGTFTSN